MFICSCSLKLNKFDSSYLNICPVLGCNISVSRVSDILLAGKEQQVLEPFIAHCVSKWCLTVFRRLKVRLSLVATVTGIVRSNRKQRFVISENSPICSILSKVLFSKSMCATKLENSACNACGLISVLSGTNLTNFTMFSIDGSASGGWTNNERFRVSKHRIKLLPHSLMRVFKQPWPTKRTSDASIGKLLEIIFIKQYLHKYFKQHLN